MSRVMVSVKTTEGGRWILPQIEALRSRDNEVVVLLPEGEGRLALAINALVSQDSGIRLLRSPFDFRFRPRLGLLADLIALRRLVASAEVEVVLYHLYATALALRLTTWGLGVRRVHMIAGPLFLESALISAVERVLWRWDDHIICGSRYIFRRYRSLGVPAARMSVVPYGVDTTRFAPTDGAGRKDARNALALPASGFVAVMVSYVYAPKRLAHAGRAIKGHEVLLSAWRTFRAHHPEATLVLVGGGFDAAGERHRQEIMLQLRENDGDHGVVWLDSVQDVRLAYQSADVSISPSLSDNHGAVLEASAMEVPCIVSDAGALAEAVLPSDGWVHRAGSAEDLLRCLEDSLQVARVSGLSGRGRNARQFMLAHFDQRATTERVVDQVCSGIKSTRARRA